MQILPSFSSTRFLTLVLTLITTLSFMDSAYASDQQPLTLDVYNASSNSFDVNATLIYGESEAVLVDTGFTKADALRIAAKVLDSDKELTTIFISQADPDYYFGAEVLHKLFPDAKIITTPAVRNVIEEKLASKLATWSPRMGKNAPTTPIVPKIYQKDSLTVDGHKIDIRGSKGTLAHRPYLWIPVNKTILGNVAVYGDSMHLWMADTQTAESLTAWEDQLKEMLLLMPNTVIPGHMKAGTKLNTKNIQYSLQYLKDFQQAKANAKNSDELVQKMLTLYPFDKTDISLSLGAKVHKGEMQW